MAAPLLWLDLETTGLDPYSCEVLEVAIVVTRDDLAPIDRFHAVTGQAAHVRPADVDPFVLDMHAQNGLWVESIARHRVFREDHVNRETGVAGEIAWLDRQLEAFVVEKIGPRDPISANRPKLAGSSVHFDLDFCRRHFPRFSALLSHRIYDVSAINEFAQRAAPEIHAARPREAGTAHRAMADIEHSIAVARYYVDALAPRPIVIHEEPSEHEEGVMVVWSPVGDARAACSYVIGSDPRHRQMARESVTRKVIEARRG